MIERFQTNNRKVKPPEVINVGPGTKWDNPFRNRNGVITINARYRRKVFAPEVDFISPGYDADLIDLYSLLILGDRHELFRKYKGRLIGEIEDFDHHVKRMHRFDWQSLRSRTLGCSCKPGSGCHADLLTELLKPFPHSMDNTMSMMLRLKKKAS